MNTTFDSASDFYLSDHAVHIWLVDLDVSDDMLCQYAGLLSSVEKERAARFFFEQHRQHYVAAHGILRILLGHYLQTDQVDVPLAAMKNGKPVVAKPLSSQRISFNLSHSDERALVGITSMRPIGVDIEKVRQIPEMSHIISHHFSAAEQALMEALTDAERLRQFYRCWVKKEALVKAQGGGLGALSASVTEKQEKNGMIMLTTLDGDTGSHDDWTLKYLEPGEGWAAAVVVQGDNIQVWDRNWPLHS
jgi:4'-phosphopantetheinyl transferase